MVPAQQRGTWDVVRSVDAPMVFVLWPDYGPRGTHDMEIFDVVCAPGGVGHGIAMVPRAAY
jgi:hypothetical protein